MGSGNAHSDIEREKLAFEAAKWEQTLILEREKLALERRNSLLSPLSLVIPLLVVALTIVANTRAQEGADRAAFQLKVTEVILQARSVTESSNRADGLAALFPERLPPEFSKRLEPLKAKLRQNWDKRGLLDILIASPRERRREILELWLLFYPNDREFLPPSLLSLESK